MEFIKKIPAIRWENGKYEHVEEETVEDENIYFYIDFLQPRKFSTYPADLLRKSLQSDGKMENMSMLRKKLLRMKTFISI